MVVTMVERTDHAIRHVRRLLNGVARQRDRYRDEAWSAWRTRERAKFRRPRNAIAEAAVASAAVEVAAAVLSVGRRSPEQ